MASATSRVVLPANEDGVPDPKILILWLDEHIGQKKDYPLLKRGFFMKVDPTTGEKVSLEQEDLDSSICLHQSIQVDIDRIQFILRVFDTVDKCFEAFENNLDKRIFLVASGSKGKILIPALVTNHRDQLKKNYPSYIFCSNMNMRRVGDVDPTNHWAMDFTDYLLMFNHQNFLLERIVLDAADYFFNEGGSLRNARDLENARQSYQWSSRLLQRYDEMNTRKINAKRHQGIATILNEIENEIRQQDEEYQVSESCT